jgi:hypothetical protein
MISAAAYQFSLLSCLTKWLVLFVVLTCAGDLFRGFESDAFQAELRPSDLARYVGGVVVGFR